LSLLVFAEAAAASSDAEITTYNPSGGSELFSNLAGVAYIALVVIFLARLLIKRARRAREQVRGRQAA
jgi:hypothetical protein